MTVAAELVGWLQSRRDAMVAGLSAAVGHESPSRDKPALDALAQVMGDRLAAVGGEVERIANPAGGDHVRAHFGPREGEPPALILGHFDTVWPFGTLARRPFRVEGGRAYGPGSYDMKAGLVMAEEALGAIRGLGLPLPRGVTVLWTSDEEIGSPTGRPLIEAAAMGRAYVLVLEPPLASGGLKTGRKGVGEIVLTVLGRSAHAGVEPEKGISAVTELALQVPRINALADPSAGTTINIGVIEGGTTTNVIPAQAVARIDVRARVASEAARIERSLAALEPITPGTVLRVTGGFHRPPMERTAAVASLFEATRTIARSLGLDLTEGPTGGGSDGNFTAALGLPTLDGLGVAGAGAHAEDEHILIDSLPERAALLALLLLNL